MPPARVDTKNEAHPTFLRFAVVATALAAVVAACSGPGPQPGPEEPGPQEAMPPDAAPEVEAPEPPPAGEGPVAGASGLPELDGRPIFDQPLAEADPRMLAAWEKFSAALDDRPVPWDPGSGQEGYESWLTRFLVPWLRGRMQFMTDLRAEVAAFAQGAEPRVELFAAVILGWLMENTMARVRAAPPPPALAGNPDLLRTYRDMLDQEVEVFAAAASEAFLRCAERAAAAPEILRPWGEVCAAHAAQLGPPAESGGPPEPDEGW